ncbi:hypothetical protein CL617_05110 [archaeon]|nr:hypothetical protein [archaeon]|tara:strand:+ start:3399 stop:3749 length:351 start_codon:yes stop_codon:yes gene_type:complete
MKENTLLKVAILCSFIGLYILFLINEKTSVDSTSIESITNESINQEVEVKGEITRITETPGLYLLNIKDNSQKEITVVVFKDSPLNLTKRNIINVYGKIEDYKGQLEIIANKIEVL